MERIKMKKRILMLLAVLALAVSSCTNTRPSNDTPSKESVPADITPSEVEPDAPALEVKSPYQADPAAITDKPKDFYAAPESGAYIEIVLKDNATEATGKGVVVTGNTVLINEKGAYMLSGTLTDGRILVDVPAADDVILYLNNVDITSKTSAPIYVRSADKAVISLMPGTDNKLTDTISSADSGTALTAALFSKPDRTLNGTGTLTVYANAKDGMTSKDDLKLMEGEVEIHAKDDGVVGNDSFVMRGGTLNIEAGGDGVKSSKEEAGKGFVFIGGGTLNVRAAGDGIDAATSIRVSDGNVNVIAGG
ncbi:MAG: carbohydrate-binding domain-containing protein, partial [Lachnospiraceae bacterium]|nr:carbohydrate-binding domain-containing protein [Lachnospiraceae bacterium]